MIRLTIFALVLFALACSPSGGRRPGTVVFASGADLQSVNALVTTHPLAKQVQRYVLLTTLVRHDSLLRAEPYLARRWAWSHDSLTLTMHVYRGLRWHDGVPTTAHDAAWTLNAARDPATGYPRLADLGAVSSVVSIDDTTLVIQFTLAQPAVPDVLADLSILPQHLLGMVQRDRMREADWNHAPVGNGPFRFVLHEANRRWVFTANHTFPAELGGPPLIERLVVAVVDEPATKLAALASGELDFAGINPAHARFVAANPDLAVLDYPLLFTYVLAFNTRRHPFDTRAVRQGLDLAIDRSAIVDGYLFGFGIPATGPVASARGSAAGGSLVDPAEASRLLGGRPVAFELLTVGSGDAALEQMLQAQLGRIGVRVTIRQLELTSFLDRIHGPARDFDAAIMGVAGDVGLGHLVPLGAVTGLPAAEDRARLVAMFADSVPAIFLYHARGVQGMNRRVHNVRMDLRGELASIREWTVR